MMWRWFASLVASAAFAVLPAAAQGTSDLEVEGPTLEGRPFRLDALRGKVVLVMFWSIRCAVCRDWMPDLRVNLGGWTDKPFAMVLVSTDARLKDLQEYGQIIGRLVPAEQRFVQLWSGSPGFRSSIGLPPQLPTTYLVDKSGKVVQKYVGRISWEEWNRIADLVYS